MIFTARQLEDLHKANGHVRLPVGSRVTPMGSDWLRQRKIAIVYDNAGATSATGGSSTASSVVTAMPRSTFATTPSPAGLVLWWCDGPCGQAKAAIASQARETNLQPMQIPTEPKYIVGAVKHLANEIKTDRAAAGVLLVQTGAAAVIFANRCPSLRAILGTCRESVQQGVDQLAANVLVIEYSYQTLQQVRNLLSQFMRSRREPSDDVKRQLQELVSCG